MAKNGATNEGIIAVNMPTYLRGRPEGYNTEASIIVTKFRVKELLLLTTMNFLNPKPYQALKHKPCRIDWAPVFVSEGSLAGPHLDTRAINTSYIYIHSMNKWSASGQNRGSVFIYYTNTI